MKKLLFTSVFSIIFLLTNAQEDLKLANSYFNSKEYEKAATLFEKLYQQKKSTYYFDYYIDCLVNLEELDKAEKKIKKEVKRNKNLVFYIDLGYIYELQGESNEAEKQFKNVVKNLPNNQFKINNIFNEFINRKKYKYAEEVLIKGNKWYPHKFLYSFIVVYSYEKDYTKMINAYLNFLKSDNKQLKLVETNITNYMKNDVNDEFATTLEQTVLQRLQKDNDDIFYELIIWFYTQRSNYEKAFIYAKSIDIRNFENGSRIYAIANNAFEVGDFETAKKAFEYLCTKGEMTTFYVKSKKMLLKIMYIQLVNGSSNTNFEQVESSYLGFIKEFGLNPNTVDIILDLADLETFYLDSASKALKLLQQAIQLRGINNNLKSQLMLKQGDIYVANNDLWKAILVYAKIENDFPNNEISDEAKFKKAKTYFYVGMIENAKSELDILKGAPSKLIANDAIYWTTFISEFSSDSTHNTLKHYARADLAHYQRKFHKSIKICDSIIDNSNSAAIPMALYLKAQDYIDLKLYDSAAENLTKIAENYKYAMWSDKAIYELADLYETKLNNKEKAKFYFKMLLFDFKGSVFSDMAKKRYKNLIEI